MSQGEREPPSGGGHPGLTQVDGIPCIYVYNVNRFSVMFSNADVLSQDTPRTESLTSVEQK